MKIKIIFLMIMLFSISFVSASEYDNVKFYDLATETVTIKNSVLGIPTTTVAKLRLLTPHYYFVEDDKDRNTKELVAMIEVEIFDTEYSNPFKEISFHDYASMVKKNRDYEYKYQYVKGTKIVEDIESRCEMSDVTKWYVCHDVVVGTHEEPDIEYRLLNPSVLKKGKTIIAIFTDVKDGEETEWIPDNWFGVSIPEWANFAGYTKLEYMEDATNTYYFSSPTRNVGQTFTMGTITQGNYIFKGVAILGGRIGGVGTARIGLYSTNASGYPQTLLSETTFNADEMLLDASRATFAWHNITMPDYTMTNGTKYAILLNRTSASEIYWRTRDISNAYAGGTTLDNNAGVWVIPGANNDQGFQVWGTSADSNITLVSPIANYATRNSSVFFNCTALDGNNVLNLTLRFNGLNNYTVYNTTSSQTSLGLTRTLTLPEGTSNWTCFYATASTTNTAALRNITIDSTAPSVLITTPANSSIVNTFSIPRNTQVNATITDASIMNNCFIDNSTANLSIPCNSGYINFTSGYRTFVYYANDSAGNIGFNSSTFLVNYIQPSLSYVSSVTEGSTITLNFTVTANLISSVSSNLSYNNTNYSWDSSTVTGTSATFGKTLNAPSISANAVIPINVTYSINGYNYSLYQTQNIIKITDLVFSSSCNDKAITVNFADEENFTSLTTSVSYNFVYGVTNSSAKQTYGSISGASTYYICINSSVSPNYTLSYGELQYTSGSYTNRRYYFYNGRIITNITENMTLYNLLDSEQTSFQLTIESSSLEPYDNVYTSLLRWYPDLNTYNIVDMGKTDEEGQTVTHLRIEDVDYRIGVYETDGTLIKLADPLRLVCLSTPCAYTLKISPEDNDYTSFLNVQYTFSFNETLNVWTFTYSDPSGTSNTMNLTIYRDTGTSTSAICSSTVTGIAGAVTCNTTGYSGTLRGVVTRTASPTVPIASKIVTLTTTAFKSGFGLFLTFLIAVPIVFIFAYISPIFAVIGGIIALIPAFYFGSINIVILGGLAVLGGIVIHFLKRIS